MYTFVLQDWITIRASAPQVTQAEPAWLDLEPYQDVTFWLQVTEVTGSPTPTLTYQTAPTADDSLFQAMTATPIALAASTTAIVTQVLMLSASTPLARFVRWQLNGSGLWDASFRIMVSANAPGMT